MTKYTQKALREMVAEGIAQDITRANLEQADAIKASEGWLRQIGYAAGLYGCNGQLLQGANTGTLYAITARTTAIYLF